MRWRDGRESDNIEDRRGMGIPRGAKVGGVGGLGLLVIVLIGMFLVLTRQLSSKLPQTQAPPVSAKRGGQPARNDDQRKFVAVVLAETEDVWQGVFQRAGRRYVPPKLVLYSGAVESACGIAGYATGPFYCPSDHKVYLDLTFFEDMQTRFGASGDFAQAYVIAHEVGHHVEPFLASPEN